MGIDLNINEKNMINAAIRNQLSHAYISLGELGPFKLGTKESDIIEEDIALCKSIINKINNNIIGGNNGENI